MLLTILKEHFKNMPKPILVHYFLFGILFIFLLFLFIPSDNTVYPEVQRGEVSDSTYKAWIEAKKEYEYENAEKKKETNWGEITAGLMALGTVWLSFSTTKQNNKLEKYQDENKKQHEEIKEVLQIVLEDKDKQKVIDSLDEITITVTNITDSDKCKVLLTILNERIREFVSDIMTDELTRDLYDYSVVKLNTEVTKTINHVEGMGFSEKFINEFTLLQTEHIVNLRQDLYTILELQVVNHKYLRFGGVVKKYLTAMSRDTLKLYNKVEAC